MVALLQDFHDPELVFGKNLGKPVGSLQLFAGFFAITGNQCSPGKDILAKAHLPGDLLCNGDVIPGHHFHVNAEFFCLGDRGTQNPHGVDRKARSGQGTAMSRSGLVRPTPSARNPFSANAVIQPSSVEADDPVSPGKRGDCLGCALWPLLQLSRRQFRIVRLCILRKPDRTGQNQ